MSRSKFCGCEDGDCETCYPPFRVGDVVRIRGSSVRVGHVFAVAGFSKDEDGWKVFGDETAEFRPEDVELVAPLLWS